MRVTMTVKEGATVIEDQSIGWLTDTPVMEIPEGRVRVRTTLVVRREAGRWKIIHAHYSVGVSDALAAEVSPA